MAWHRPWRHDSAEFLHCIADPQECRAKQCRRKLLKKSQKLWRLNFSVSELETTSVTVKNGEINRKGKPPRNVTCESSCCNANKNSEHHLLKICACQLHPDNEWGIVVEDTIEGGVASLDLRQVSQQKKVISA